MANKISNPEPAEETPVSETVYAPERGAYVRARGGLTFNGRVYLEGEPFPLDGMTEDKIREMWLAHRIGFGGPNAHQSESFKRQSITRDALRKNRTSMTIEEYVARGNEAGTYPPPGTVEIPSDGLEVYREKGVVPHDLVQPYVLEPDRDRRHLQGIADINEQSSTEKHVGRTPTDEELAQAKAKKANEGGASKVDADKSEAEKAKRETKRG